ncbi:hypothetical protein JCM10450v2_002492 [Rhodotorula kratochvilovae]
MIVSGSSRLLLSSTRAARPACAACGPSQRRAAHKLVAIQLTEDVPALGSRGQVVAASPGLARNRLVPAGLALYVGRDGKAVSILGDMERRAAAHERGLQGVLAKRREAEREARARKVLDELSGAVAEDPLEPARAGERALETSLSSAVSPAAPLVFTRLTTSPTSSDLFGSVSVSDVLAVLRDRGVQGLHEGMGAFAEGQDGVQNGRVKRIGAFVFEVELKALGKKVPVIVEVGREEKA